MTLTVTPCCLVSLLFFPWPPSLAKSGVKAVCCVPAVHKSSCTASVFNLVHQRSSILQWYAKEPWLSSALPRLVSSVLFTLLFHGHLVSSGFVSSGWQFFCLQLSSCIVLGTASDHEKKERFFLDISQHVFMSTCSRYVLESYQLRVSVSKCVLGHIVHSEEIIHRYFWDTYASSVSSVSFDIFSHPFTRRKKTPECTQKGQCFWKVTNSRWNANLRLKKKSLHWAIKHLEFDFVTQERNFPAGWQWFWRVSVWLLIN